MMVTTMGEDYVTFAEAKGLRSATIFTRYCMRNAILPQTTGLALALGQILSGAVLVEAIFGYPGIGALLFQAIEENDFFLIQGIVFTVISCSTSSILGSTRASPTIGARPRARLSRAQCFSGGRTGSARDPGSVHGGRGAYRRHWQRPAAIGPGTPAALVGLSIWH
jgi:hypothetical protein